MYLEPPEQSLYSPSWPTSGLKI